MSKKVLIGGGSGLVGQRLTTLLKEKGYDVSHLSRSAGEVNTPTIQWNVDAMNLDPTEIEDFDFIVNLAGTGIADKSWTTERKKVIVDSRVKSNQLLAETIQKNSKKPKAYVSASGVGFYGFTPSEKIFTEEDLPGNDFLADTCVLWEQSTQKIKELGIPTAHIRIGLVLSKKGGALKELAKPIEYYVGAPLGNGKQYMPWIHIDDLCRIFIHTLENKLTGAFNAGVPNQLTNKSFTQVLAKVLKKPLWLPHVPSFVIKLILGSRALLVLRGNQVSPKKIQDTGFEFQYSELEAALTNIYDKSI